MHMYTEHLQKKIQHQKKKKLRHNLPEGFLINLEKNQKT